MNEGFIFNDDSLIHGVMADDPALCFERL